MCQGFDFSLACRLKRQVWELSDVCLKRVIDSRIRIFEKALKSHQSQVDGGYF